MSRERSASAITSLPKPGALAPAGVGRSRPATAGSAALVLARAVADWDGVMAGISSSLGSGGRLGRIQPDHERLSNRAVSLCMAIGGSRPFACTLLVRRLRRFAAAQLLDEQGQAVGKAVAVKTPGI